MQRIKHSARWPRTHNFRCHKSWVLSCSRCPISWWGELVWVCGMENEFIWHQNQRRADFFLRLNQRFFLVATMGGLLRQGLLKFTVSLLKLLMFGWCRAVTQTLGFYRLVERDYCNKPGTQQSSTVCWTRVACYFLWSFIILCDLPSLLIVFNHSQPSLTITIHYSQPFYNHH